MLFRSPALSEMNLDLPARGPAVSSSRNQPAGSAVHDCLCESRRPAKQSSTTARCEGRVMRAAKLSKGRGGLHGVENALASSVAPSEGRWADDALVKIDPALTSTSELLLCELSARCQPCPSLSDAHSLDYTPQSTSRLSTVPNLSKNVSNKSATEASAQRQRERRPEKTD